LEAWSAQELSYPIAVSALWAIELVYNAGWAICLDEGAHTPQDLRDCCQRWGSPDFGEYVRKLKEMADRTLEGATEAERKEAEAAFAKILDQERAFWEMSGQ
jgi:thiaminase